MYFYPTELTVFSEKWHSVFFWVFPCGLGQIPEAGRKAKVLVKLSLNIFWVGKTERGFGFEGMQQHLMQMQPTMAAYYSNNVTTDHIQQYLDENKTLILKIVESQNSGKINECAESFRNQARLQRNLMYLAAIADAQHQPPTMHSQYSTSSVMQPTGGLYMQHQQAQAMSPQALMAARSSMLYSQQPYAALQQQQTLHSQMGMSSMGSGGLTILQGEPNNSGGFSDFGRATVSKQELGGAGSVEGRGDGTENLYLKSSDDGN